MKILFLIALLLCVSAFAKGSPKEDVEMERRNYTCGKEQLRGVEFRYCYRNKDVSNSDDIVYFLHGLDGDETTWFSQWFGTLLVQRRWYDRDYKPRVVAVSFGPEWLLVNNSKYPLLPFFTQGVMPLMEAKMGGLGKGKRHLIGQSMGGFNGSQLSLKYPGLFSRVALICPAFTTVGPFSKSQEIDSYIKRTGARPELVDKMLRISRNAFVDQQDWDRHDPLKVLKNYHHKTKVKFYLSVGMNDGYGFQEGTKTFYSLSRAGAFDSRWSPVSGGHCNFNRRATADFIMGDRR